MTPYNVQLDSSNALEIIRMYDAVIDATDNVVTRYLLNDACVMSGKPLVSASALKLEGQLTIYNYRPKEPQVKHFSIFFKVCDYRQQKVSNRYFLIKNMYF